jgi:hypothetical protein
MQNKNRKIEKPITRGTQRFTWFGLNIHRRHPRESFTKKIWRLQRWHQNTLTKPKPQIHLKSSLCHSKEYNQRINLFYSMLRYCTNERTTLYI